eukprot:10712274-Alexandrium_andersonii.AAC.1
MNACVLGSIGSTRYSVRSVLGERVIEYVGVRNLINTTSRTWSAFEPGTARARERPQSCSRKLPRGV